MFHKTMKNWAVAALFFCFSVAPDAKATHIIGGEMCYVCVDPANYIYTITMKFYRDCRVGNASYDDVMNIGVYDSAGVRISTLPLGLTLLLPPTDTLPNETYDFCLFAPPTICVEEAIYSVTKPLPPIPGGYTLLFQRCCRNATLQNIISPLSTGSVWTLQIPDTAVGGCNTSACYKVFPPTIICGGQPINFDHSAAIDPDSAVDVLTYELCDVITRNFAPGDPVPLPPPTLPGFASVNYIPPFDSHDPLGELFFSNGDSLKIDSLTGLLTGVPGALGQFVVGICIKEWRNGVNINTNRRDFQFNIAICDTDLVADFTSFIEVCASDYSVQFGDSSKSVSGWPLLNVNYVWDFGDPGNADDTSTQRHPVYIYADTGTYLVTLMVNPGLTCADTVSKWVTVPFFNASADFSFDTVCVGVPVDFSSLITIPKPNIFVTDWLWDFDDGTLSTDSGNTVHTYFDADPYTVTLFITTNNGCMDSVKYPVVFHEIPQVIVAPPTATLLLGSSKTLEANASEGEPPFTYVWSPLENLEIITASMVKVTPTRDIIYTCTITDANGCIAADDVPIFVKPTVTLEVPTAFTPNNDGLNDVFLAYDVDFRDGAGIDEIDFRVFNRWGEVVYHAENVDQALNIGWDGTHRKNGKKMEVGVYVWLLEATKLNGDKIGPLYGNVSLLR